MPFQRLLSSGFAAAPAVAAMPAPPAPPASARPLLHLSEAAADWMERQRRRGLAQRTLDDVRLVLWNVIEFIGVDLPQRELVADMPRAYLAWRRITPAARRKAGSLPADFSRASVARFLDPNRPPRRERAGEMLSEQRIGHYWAHAGPFFAFLGLPVAIEDQRDLPNLRLPPPLVPRKATVQEWWRDCLGHTTPNHSAADRRLVVLIQGIVLATGMRIEEALRASMANVEGNWLLLERTKTHAPRILYLSAQVLGIVAALHPPAAQRVLFDAGDDPGAPLLAGWWQSLSGWHGLVRGTTTAATQVAGEKRQQSLRRVLATWLHRRDPVVECATGARRRRRVSQLSGCFRTHAQALGKVPLAAGGPRRLRLAGADRRPDQAARPAVWRVPTAGVAKEEVT